MFLVEINIDFSMHILTQSKLLQTKQLFILVGLINSGGLKCQRNTCNLETISVVSEETTFLLNFNNMGEKFWDIVIRLCAEKWIKSLLNDNINNT